jgi:hypothetical protein
MRLLTHFLIASTLCLFGLGTAQAGDHIKDGLGLFSEQAKTAANRQIDQVHQKHGWTIAVETRDAAETIPTLPTDKSKQNEFLTSWTTKHYEANNLKGVYIAVFKNPSKFRIHIDTDQKQKMGVTQSDISSWSTLLEDNLREKDFDAALLSTVGGISAKLSRTNAGSAAPGAPLPGNAGPVKQIAHKPEQRAAGEEGGPSIMMWILIAVGVFIIFRIIRGVMSSMSSANTYGPGGTPNQYGPGGGANMGGPNMGGPGYGQGGYGAPSRGGGMMSGMLGGLFGGMAGSWMYDKMSGGHQSHNDSGQGNYTSHDSSRDDSGSLADQSPAESDSTTYGGDWGSDSSSSDSGGGGDFGGDAGGGGDGGGDW